MKDNYWKEESKLKWFTTLNDGENLPAENLQTGCLMRIADATELMAKNYTQMQSELAWYQKSYAEQRARIATLEKRVAAYKGIVRRSKKK